MTSEQGNSSSRKNKSRSQRLKHKTYIINKFRILQFCLVRWCQITFQKDEELLRFHLDDCTLLYRCF
jgi:hypothetical protein